MDIETQVTFWTNLILFVFFITSELLGCSSCEANSITQLINCPCGRRRIKIEKDHEMVIATLSPV